MTDCISEVSRQLREEFPYRMELHAHTNPASSCSEIPPRELVERYIALGVHTVCLTNHLARRRGDDGHWLEDYYATKAAGDELGLNIVLGAELRFPGADCDFLVYGIAPEEYSEIISMLDMDIASFSKAFRNDRHLLIEAHPLRDGLPAVDFDLLDGVEAFNAHPHHNSRVALAAQKCHRAGKLITAGTDFHHRGHEGLGLTLCRFAPTDSFQVADLLRSRDFIMEIGGSIVLP